MGPENRLELLRSVEPQEVGIDEVLNRGVETLLPDGESLRAEMQSRRIRLYLGIDATSPDLHIGHTVPLRKLRQFKELGHEVILLFGGFTSLIGDPTDKSATRVKLTPEQVQRNMATYAEQAGRILDMSPNSTNPVIIKNNNDWLSKLTFEDVIELEAHFTVQRMLDRSMFRERIEQEKPVYLHEFSYPLMQGYDSVAMDVDLELGGRDQLFNMLVGRTLVERLLGHEKWVMGMRLIEDPGGKKMGKTEGNIVNIFDRPEVKYEGIMTWPDTAIGLGFELITFLPMERVREIQQDILPAVIQGRGGIHPMELKEALAYRVVAELDGADAADYAQQEFHRVKRLEYLPRTLQEVMVNPGTDLVTILSSSGLAQDEGEAQRLITAGAVYVDGKLTQKNIKWGSHEGLVQIGKKTIRLIRKVVIRENE